jgi:hypothetical protein
VLEHGEPYVGFGALRDRDVDRIAATIPGPHIAERSSPRIKPGLVDAGEQDVRAPAKDLGGAVAVVNVPVEDQHAV